MIKINKNVIKKFNPCKERFDNYLEHYSTFNGSFDDFLDLDKISYFDKIWIAKKVLNKNELVHFAVLCAQSVLSIYENKYPNDSRVRDCIEYMMNITDFSNLDPTKLNKLKELRSAAYAAYKAACAAADDANDAARKAQEDLNLSFLKIVSKL